MPDKDPTIELKENIDNARNLLQLTSPPPPAVVREWLGQLGMLYGVPFENIVADAKMLPPESMRFFYVDTNWIESLVDGALSTGAHSDRDIRFHRVMRRIISKVTDEAAGKVREQLRRPDQPASSDAPLENVDLDQRIRAGFLMRSAIVSGWPGLEIHAFRGPAEQADQQLKALRIERLAPDVLMVIFEDIPELVVIQEPQEGLHFGTGEDPATGQKRGILRGAGSRPGMLDLEAMKKAQAVNDSARFAIKMVDPPDKQNFKAVI